MYVIAAALESCRENEVGVVQRAASLVDDRLRQLGAGCGAGQAEAVGQVAVMTVPRRFDAVVDQGLHGLDVPAINPVPVQGIATWILVVDRVGVGR